MESVLDKASLLERLDGDQELLAELIELFLADCPNLLEEIRSAVASGDAPLLMRAAHTLKGSVSNFCAPRATEASQRLETLGRDGNIADAPAALASLENLIEHLRSELQLLATAVAV